MLGSRTSPAAAETHTYGAPPTEETPAASGLPSALIDREQALNRAEHRANVLRVRWIWPAASFVWPAFGVLDWFVATHFGAGRLGWMLGLRALGLVPILIVVPRILRDPPLTPDAFRRLEVGAFTSLSAILSMMCLSYGGITSPYAGGICVVLVCRGVTLANPWRQALVSIGLPTLAYPLVLLGGAALMPSVRAQFSEPASVAAFIQNAAFMFSIAGFLIYGSHATWRLRRETLKSRNLGRYRLKNRLGTGGMGEVWAAYHEGLKRDVAVKLLRAEAGEQAVARFEREVRATAELNHPNTVRVYDYGTTEDGIWYYAMELLEGADLEATVRDQGPLAPRRAVHLVAQAARALAEAHAKGLVHRDVKPANLFVACLGGETDFTKVLDFGIAKGRGQEMGQTLTQVGWVGTPAYMAPEVVLGNDADPRSDVYSLGGVLYFILTGRRPIDGATVAQVLMSQVHDRPLPLSEVAKQPIPADLEVIVMRALEKEPAARYPSAAEMAAALDAVEEKLMRLTA